MYYLQLNPKQLGRLNCLLNYDTCLNQVSYEMLSNIPLDKSIIFMYPGIELNQEYLSSRDILVFTGTQKITKKYDYIVLFGSFDTISQEKRSVLIKAISKILKPNGKVLGWFTSGDEISILRNAKKQDVLVYEDFCYKLQCFPKNYKLTVLNKPITTSEDHVYVYGIEIIKEFAQNGLQVEKYSRVYGGSMELSYSAFSLQKMLRVFVFTKQEIISTNIPQYLAGNTIFRYSDLNTIGHKLVDFIKPNILQRIIDNFSVTQYLKIPELIEEDVKPYVKLITNESGKIDQNKLDEFINDKLDKFVQKHKLSTISTRPNWINTYIANLLGIEIIDPYSLTSSAYGKKGSLVMYPDGEVQFITLFSDDIQYENFIEKVLVDKYSNYIDKERRKSPKESNVLMTIGIEQELYQMSSQVYEKRKQ